MGKKNGVASKLRKTSPASAGRLSRPFSICFRLRSNVIALAVYRKEDVDHRMKRCLVARRKLRQALNNGTLRVLAMLTVSQLSKSFGGQAVEVGIERMGKR